jgi:hypothetical protein
MNLLIRAKLVPTTFYIVRPTLNSFKILEAKFLVRAKFLSTLDRFDIIGKTKYTCYKKALKEDYPEYSI